MTLLPLLLLASPLDGALKLELEGRDADALTAVDTLIRQDPSDMIARIEDARLRLKLGQGLEIAELHLEAARARLPENPRAHYLWALLCDERGRRSEARRALDVALTLRPDYADARFRLAGLEYADGDYRNAAQSYASYAATHPEALGARLQLAAALDRAGQSKEAEAELRRLSKAGHVIATQRLADLLERSNRKPEAASLRRSLEGPKRALRELRPSGR